MCSTKNADFEEKEHSVQWFLLVAFGLAFGLVAVLLYFVAQGIITHLLS